MNKSADNSNAFNFSVEGKMLADKAFWKIDSKVGELFDEFITRNNLPIRDKRGSKITCRGPDTRDRYYDELYYESVEKACEIIKNDSPSAYQELVNEHGCEEALINEFKFA